MKVYVDELPKNCLECPCRSDIWCNIEHYYIGNMDKVCPLQSLSEHNKAKDHQIELLNKRWELLKEFIEKDHDWNLERGNNDRALGQRWVLEKMQELEQEFCEKIQ